MSEMKNEIAKKHVVYETALTKDIPKDEIIVEKLSDGFAVKVEHNRAAKSKNSWYESTFAYHKEEHFGMPVNNVVGRFNENGNYEVMVEFDEDETKECSHGQKECVCPTNENEKECDCVDKTCKCLKEENSPKPVDKKSPSDKCDNPSHPESPNKSE